MLLRKHLSASICGERRKSQFSRRLKNSTSFSTTAVHKHTSPSGDELLFDNLGDENGVPVKGSLCKVQDNNTQSYHLPNPTNPFSDIEEDSESDCSNDDRLSFDRWLEEEKLPNEL